MKSFKNILLGVLCLLVMTSCEDYFGSDANVDPDNPIEVTENVLLPQVQVRLAYTYGGDFTRYLGLNTQHVTGVNRQFAVLGKYGILGSDVDQSWANIYTGVMNSNRRLYNQAIESGFNHYAGISAALEAYTMMCATDVWGDIPYSDAFKFDENAVYSPTFDAQESIYTALFAKIDEARTLLGGDDGGNAVGADDQMYAGDIDKWIKFCNVLEARGRLHLSQVNGSAYSEVMSALNQGSFTSSADDGEVAFGAAASENSPWYQYIEQRDDCEVGAGYVAILESFNDPRLATYGAEHSLPHPVFTKEQPVTLISYTEQQFMMAEAMLSSDANAAYDAYLAGIASSFAEAGMTTDDYDAYIADPGVGTGAGNLTMNNIMTQKYIALYTSPEVFNDWRRTGLPALTPVTGTQIPVRLPYAETELFSNTNTPSPSEVNIFTPVWWDK